MKSDRELLELAARAAGIELWHEDVFTNGLTQKVSANGVLQWNPLTDDGDALRLAVRLRIIVTFSGASGEPCVIGCQRLGPDSIEKEGTDPYAATRRAIVRAAAKIGEGK